MQIQSSPAPPVLPGTYHVAIGVQRQLSPAPAVLPATHQVVIWVQTQPTGHAMQQATYGAPGGPGTPAPAHLTVPAVQGQTYIVFGASCSRCPTRIPQVPPVQPPPVHTNFQNLDGMQTYSYGYNYGNTTAMPPVDYYSSSSAVGNQLATG